ncbi:MAG: thioredoxin domain-containing protein [Bryobacteraceae bacterium]
MTFYKNTFAALFWSLAVLLAPPALAQSRAPAAASIDKQALEDYIRYLYLWPPDVKIEISDARPSVIEGLREFTFKVSASSGASFQQTLFLSTDGRRILRGEVFDLGRSPFQETASKITLRGQPSLGPENAPVVVVLFSDFQCPYCSSQAQVIRGNLTASYPTQVRLVFHDFPLEQIHPWARQAAIAGRCIFQQSADAFWEYHDWIFAQQAQISPQNLNDKVMEFSRGRPLDGLLLSRCLQTRATEAEVERSIQEGRSLNVDATPTLFVNGRRISQQVTWQQLKGLIDNELRYLSRKEAQPGQP